jgi:hypothetical protein
VYRETITHAGGTTDGTASEAHARMLLVRAVRRGYTVEATATGGAVITWTRALFGPGANSAVTAHRAIHLHPVTPVGALVDAVRDDLARIDGDHHAAYELDRDRRVITGLVWRIPPYTTARLRARSLVTEQDGHVRLTLTALLGLLAHEHRTTTTEPEGWHRPHSYEHAGLNRPGRRAGMMLSTASAAVCTCRALSAMGGTREDARRLGRDHRRAVAAAFVADRLAAPAGLRGAAPAVGARTA